MRFSLTLVNLMVIGKILAVRKIRVIFRLIHLLPIILIAINNILRILPTARNNGITHLSHFPYSTVSRLEPLF